MPISPGKLNCFKFWLCKLLSLKQLHTTIKRSSVIHRTLIKIGNFEAAQKTIDKLNADTQSFELLQAALYHSQSNASKSIELLESTGGESSEQQLLLARCYIDVDQRSNALIALRKSAKLCGHNSQPFYWMARIYYASSDLGVALKCLQKCCDLHPHHSGAVSMLSGLYRHLIDYTANWELLKRAAHPITGFTRSTDKWVGVLLGFHHLCLKQFNDAIASFRTALRSDAADVACWEGLADAYLQRGSLSSALRVYQKITELVDVQQNPYALLQVANVKCTMKMHREAIESYSALLANRPDFVAALKGCAEAHLGLAYHSIAQRLLARAKLHAEEAVRLLTE